MGVFIGKIKLKEISTAEDLRRYLRRKKEIRLILPEKRKDEETSRGNAPISSR